METSVSTEEMDDYEKLKTQNKNLMAEILHLKRVIYDLKNLHVELKIEDNKSIHEDDESSTRDSMSPYEQMFNNKEHIKYLWDKRKSEIEWPFKINEDMSNLEITRRKEALKLYKERIEEHEIYDMIIDDTIYLSDGLLVIEVIDDEELSDVIGYIDQNVCENDAEQVIFFK